jgi:hypothetical protein
MEWSRYDLSTVRSRGEYVATRCPVRAQWDELTPVDPNPPGEVAQRKAAAGVAFEEELVGEPDLLIASADGGNHPSRSSTIGRASGRSSLRRQLEHTFDV